MNRTNYWASGGPEGERRRAQKRNAEKAVTARRSWMREYGPESGARIVSHKRVHMMMPAAASAADSRLTPAALPDVSVPKPALEFGNPLYRCAECGHSCYETGRVKYPNGTEYVNCTCPKCGDKRLYKAAGSSSVPAAAPAAPKRTFVCPTCMRYVNTAFTREMLNGQLMIRYYCPRCRKDVLTSI